MKLRLIAVLAAFAMLTACETTTDDPNLEAEMDSTQETFVESEIDASNAKEFLMAAKDRVFFAFDSAELSQDAANVLKVQAEWLKANPTATAVVEGHCDERGTREYNLALGEKRANAAKNYLVLRGVESSRIVTRSYGKDHPAVTGHNEAAWAQNRRSVTIVSYK